MVVRGVTEVGISYMQYAGPALLAEATSPGLEENSTPRTSGPRHISRQSRGVASVRQTPSNHAQGAMRKSYVRDSGTDASRLAAGAEERGCVAGVRVARALRARGTLYRTE